MVETGVDGSRAYEVSESNYASVVDDEVNAGWVRVWGSNGAIVWICLES